MPIKSALEKTYTEGRRVSNKPLQMHAFYFVYKVYGYHSLDVFLLLQFLSREDKCDVGCFMLRKAFLKLFLGYVWNFILKKK